MNFFGDSVTSVLPKSKLDDATIKNYLKLLIEINPTPKVRIPETVIFGYGFQEPTFLYTRNTGEIAFVENITIK